MKTAVMNRDNVHFSNQLSIGNRFTKKLTK